MSQPFRFTLCLLCGILLAAACTPPNAPTATPLPEANMPNPASVFCEENNGKLEMRQDAEGNVTGICIFPDGSECEEWAYYRGECAPGGATGGVGLANPASVFCEENGGKLEMRQDAEGNVTGFCIFPDGSECDEWAYFRGECAPGGATGGVSLANPASVFCEENGGKLEMRQDAEGNVTGFCLFPDGSECEEWAYFRGECAPGGAAIPPAALPTPLPIDPAEYAGWWTYTHPVYGFSLQLPSDWVVDETTTSDPLLNGHLLLLHPQDNVDPLSIRLTFRKPGEDVLLWPTGVGEGEFIPHGVLDVAGAPARRMIFVCPTGQVASAWYHQSETEPNLQRGGLEFGFIFGYEGRCQEGYNLGGKVLRVGDMIVASLVVP